MDPLALLCNLHADGPSTLRALRRAGCDSLASLEGVPTAELCELLGADALRAGRFVNEARLLRDRLGSELLGEEAPPAIPAEPETAPSVAPRRPLVEAVVSEWGERDARETTPNASVEEPAEAPELAPDSVGPVGVALEDAPLDGLDPSGVGELRRAGIETVEELVEASALDLSREEGLGYTWLLRLQFLARRKLGDTLRPPAPVAPVRMALGSAGAAEDGDAADGGTARALDAAGPFA